MTADGARPELTLTGLRVVRAVAATGSFTAAAEALGYTQSAVSRQVAAVERATGTTLFRREARGVRPTRAGDALLVHAAAVLDAADATLLALRGLEDRLEGRLAVGGFPSAMAALVPRAVAALRREHPGVELTLGEGSSPTHLRRLRAGRLEVAVVALDDAERRDAADVRIEPLLVGRSLVAVPAGHPLARAASVVPGDLEDVPWIVGAGRGGDPVFGPWPGLRSPRVAFAARGWTARLGLVAAGLGVALVPAVAAASVPAGVALVEVDGAREGGRDAYVATAHERGPAAAALVAALHAEARALD